MCSFCHVNHESIRSDSKIQFVEGLPVKELTTNENDENILFVFDDLIDQVYSSQLICNLFVQGRNRNISLILITQNLFTQLPFSRTIALNANYLLIFRIVRDQSTIGILSRQICPKNSKSFRDLFINTITKPYDHLLLNFSSDSDDLLRFQQNIFDEIPAFFISEDDIKRRTKSISSCSTTREID